MNLKRNFLLSNLVVMGGALIASLFDMNEEQNYYTSASSNKSNVIVNRDFFSMSQTFVFAGVKSNGKNERLYSNGYTKKNKETLKWIIETLAWGDDVKVLSNSVGIWRKGNTLETLHPLCFCEIFLSEEKLRCGVLKIKTKGILISKPFFNGITKSLEKEDALNNIREEDVRAFAAKVKMDFAILYQPLRKKDWSGFVDVLLENMKRNTDTDYLNM